MSIGELDLLDVVLEEILGTERLNITFCTHVFLGVSVSFFLYFELAGQLFVDDREGLCEQPLMPAGETIVMDYLTIDQYPIGFGVESGQLGEGRVVCEGDAIERHPEGPWVSHEIVERRDGKAEILRGFGFARRLF